MDSYLRENSKGEVIFNMSWRFASADWCSAAYSIIQRLEAANGVVFDGDNITRKPQIDSASENVGAALMALARDEFKKEILKANTNSPEYEPIVYEITIDGHLDGAADQTIFSMCLRDDLRRLLENGKFGSLPRQVLLRMTLFL